VEQIKLLRKEIILMAFTIKEWRRLRGFSQQTMAEKCGVHVNTYAYWEKHPSNLSIEKARIIANALQVSFDDIFFEDDSAFCGIYVE
jgi:transcriptional regulator with XRE-family HTH domain